MGPVSRCTGRVAIAALLLLAVPETGVAQSEQTLVSSRDQTTSDPIIFGVENPTPSLADGRLSSPEKVVWQPFTTGAVAGGYRLTEISVVVRRHEHTYLMYLGAEIKNSRPVVDPDPFDGIPVVRTIADLGHEIVGERNETPVPFNQYVFHAPDNIILSPNTTYYLYMQASAEVEISSTTETALDTDSHFGWTMGRAFVAQGAGSYTYIESLDDFWQQSAEVEQEETFRIRVKGVPILPSVTVDAPDPTIEFTEGDAVTFTLRRTGSTTDEMTVNMGLEATSTGENGIVTAEAISQTTATFAANEETTTVTVQTRNNETYSVTPEMVTISLTPVASATTATPLYAVGTSSSAEVQIGDDDPAATVSGVAVTSTAPRYREVDGANVRDVYGAGDTIEFTVTFSDTVEVDTTNGVPTLAFSLGNADAVQTNAPYVRGGGTNKLVFAYTVQAADSDNNGIFLLNDSNVTGGALQLNGGALSAGINGVVSTAITTRGAQPDHKVDGSRSGPYIESLAVTSTPQITRDGQTEPDTYGTGETIAFTLTLSEAVTVTGTPHLQFSLGGTNTNATYARGSGSNKLVFAYTVRDGDADDDGIFVQDGQDLSGNSAVVVESGESIAAMDDSTDADLVNPDRGIRSGHRVDGSMSALDTAAVLSIVRQVPAVSPTNADSLTWRVTFSEDVRNVDPADFTLTGTTATLAVTAVTASTIYDVTASGGDLADLNNTVTLGFASGQDITDTAATPNTLTATTPPAGSANETTYDMDNTAPTVTITVPSETNAPFLATFTFSEPVTGFTVGDITVGNGTALNLTGGDGATTYTATITPAATREVTVDVTVDVAANVATDAAGNGNVASEQTVSAHSPPPSAVIRGVAVTSTPPRYREVDGANIQDVYGAGDVIEFTVTFSNPVDVDTMNGVPTLTFSLGNANAVQTNAPYVRGSGTEMLVFAYTVQAADSDDNGIFLLNDSRVTGGALQLNGGVLSAGTNGAVFTASTTHGARSGHKVDGSRSGPYATSLEVTSTPLITRDGQTEPDTYGAGETIMFTLTLSEAVMVTGTPHLQFSLGGKRTNADYTRGSGSNKLVFAYTVRDGDTDNNGIFVHDGEDISGNSAVVVESGESIAAMDDSAAADLVNPDRGIRSGHRVDGSMSAFDAANVTVDPTTVDLTEGETLTYSVTLVIPPPGNITISPNNGDSGAVSVEPASLTFTTSNWDTAQTVTVTGAQDDDASNERVTISHSISGYGSVTTNSVTVTVTDNDTAGVNVTPTSVADLNEGGTATYTLKLDTEPSGNVTITPGSSDSGAVSVEPASLTFTTSNWDTPRMVSMTGVQDGDTSNETVTVSHSVSGYGAVTSADSVTVTVTDNDTDGVSVDPTSVSPSEGGTLSYTVTLVTLPSGNVTITPSSSDSGAVSVEPASLTFTASNWDTPRTVSVTAEVDDDASNETVTVSHSVSGYGAVTSADSVTVTVTDNDTAGVIVDPTSVDLTEGGTLTYSVTLVTLPSGNVTITPSSSDSGAVSVEPASLTFTASNWDTPRTVSVTGVVDDDASNETVTISHDVSGYGSVTADSVTVSVMDNDTAGVMMEPTSVDLNEEGTVTYTVKLTTQPSETVTITPANGDTSAVSVSPASLTFTTSNWDTTQTVTLTGVNDSDGDSETVTISHGVSGYGSVTADSVTVSVTDNDTAGVMVEPTSVDLNEEGMVTYTVKLTTDPGGSPVTITPANGDTSAVSVSPARLTFTTSNWDTTQTVTLTGVNDSDGDSETVTISHSVSGYGSVTAGSVTVSVMDNDTAGVMVEPTSVDLNEEGMVTYTVKLTTQPSETVTITPANGDTSAVSVSSASLTFTTSNWDTTQTVTLTGVNDSDGISETVTISHSVSGYGSVTADSVTVSVTDNDTTGVMVEPTSVDLNEEGMVTYTVKLNTDPGGNPVTITPANGDTSAVSVSSASLTFTTSNWDTTQTITLIGVNDSDGISETVTISHSVSGYGSVTADSVTVSVTDNDTAGVMVEPTSVDLNEEGTVTYTVKLNTQPSETVTITPNNGDTSAVSVSSASLTFTTSNWDTTQTVTLTGVNDSDGDSETVTISHSVSGYGSVTADSVTVSVTDNDTAGVMMEPTSVDLNEEGMVTYTVKLNTQPSETVTITPANGDTSAVSVSPASLTFTTSNWDTTQTITLTGVNDSDGISETVTISHSVSGYGSVTADSVTVSVMDNDTAGVMVEPTSVDLNEEGMVTYTVKLNTDPGGSPVTITPNNGDTSAVSVSPASLTFTTSNWDTTQTVTLIGVNDGDGVSETVTVSHSVSGYGSVTADSVTVSVTDNDIAGVMVEPTSVDLNEEGTVTYTVKLNTQPSETVTITPANGDTSAVSVSPASLTFTTSNWDTTQTVTLTGVNDSDGDSETVTISHSVSGYGSVTAGSVTVSVMDNDTAGVMVEPTSVDLNEEGMVTYTVKLNTDPGGSPVTITPNNGDTSAVSVSPASLTFTTSNWDTTQTVTLIGVNDGDGDSEMVTISHDVSGYGSVTANSVTVSVTDNDIAGVMVEPTSVDLNEEGMVTYTVKLNTDPGGSPVTITPNNGDTSAVSVSSASLTFTTSNWDTTQTITLIGVNDGDGDSEMVTISHSVSGYGSVTADSVTVSVTDNDTAGVMVEPTSVDLNEEGTVTYTVKLNTQPSETVTITPANGDTSAVSVSPASLTFTTSNWDTTQTVTLTGVNDSDGISETVTISHSVSGYGSVTADSVTVSVTDNDTAGVMVEPTSVDLNEEGMVTYTVKLTTQPSETVTITPNNGDTSAVSVSSASLTFTTSNWDTTQTITLIGVNDGDGDSEMVTISHDVSGYGSVTADSVTVSVMDNDTAGVMVEPTSVDLNEEGMVTYTVKLNTQPSGPVTITPANGDTRAVSVSPASLTFTTSNWDTTQTVTLTGVNDSDGVSETVTISHGVSGYGSVTAGSVTVSVTDNDAAGVMVEPTSVDLNEEETVTYTVKLTTQPSETVTITPNNGDTSAVSVSPASLTFTTSNWDTTQTVTLTGVNDSDGDSETVIISHGVSGYGSVTAGSVTVSVTDNDAAGVMVEPTSVDLNEEGMVTYTVKLNTDPGGSPVTITPANGDTSAVSVSPASLTFTTSNWDTTQTMTLTGVNDSDGISETVTISHSVSGYGSVTANSVTVSVMDNDTAGVMVEPTSVDLNEEGMVTYTVKLNTQPSETVTITPNNGDTSAVSVSSASLTFTTSNWDTTQTITLIGVNDSDGISEMVTVSHSVSGYGSVTADSVTVSVMDNDTAGVMVEPTSVDLNEEGMVTYTVKLNTQPSETVTITPSSSDSGAVGVSPASLTFTTSNWDTTQTVTLTGVNDSDGDSETVTISHSVSGYGSVTAGSVTVSVMDNDTTGVMVEPTSVDLNEEGMVTYTVKLNTQPSETVTITPANGDTSAVSVSPSSLTFTTSNWNTSQTVTLTGVNDSDGDSETVTISHDVSGYGSVTADSVTVSVMDNDTAGVMVEPTSVDLNEEGMVTYTVKLTTQPSETVTITPANGDTSAVSFSPSSLTFTTSNWDTTQTVTLTSVNDSDGDSETVTISHSVSGYGSVTADSVTVSVMDNDTAGVMVEPTSVDLNEEGMVTYTVKLNTDPGGNPVTITPNNGDTSAVSVSSASLTFTTSNWDTTQTITLIGVNDSDGISETVTISHSVSGYGSVTADSVMVSVMDNDTAGVSVSTATLTVGEESSGTYTVTLNTPPPGPVTISPTSGDSGAMGVEPASLTFTTANWDTAQTVSVTAVDDPDTANETVTVSHSVNGYGSVTADSVMVTVMDNDTAGVSVSIATLTVGEESSGTYTVTLNTPPPGPVTISPSSSDSGAVSVEPASITFTAANWDTPRTVSVTGVQDDDANNEMVTISHSVSGYGSVTANSVTVSVTDHDTAGVMVDPTSVDLTEGGTLSYSVTLVTQPPGPVTITPSSSDSGAVSVEPASITFTAANWDTPRTVSVIHCCQLGYAPDGERDG